MSTITYLNRYECVITENGCHECISHTSKTNGYVRVKNNGKMYRLHRLIYEIANGEIPIGLVVRHKCDNRSCINVDHLELGTPQDNTNDKMERGRHKYGESRGEKNPSSKITEDDVRAIRADKVSTNIALAEKYGVHHSMISAIRLHKYWKHVT